MIRVGTRASALARTQSGTVARAVEQATGEQCVLVDVRTHGDRSSAPLAELARSSTGAGLFVSALREALVAGDVDVAVHSLKDLPTAAEPGIALAAVPEREDPRDALVTRGGVPFTQLPSGARVGTGSPRRAAMLRALAQRHSVDIEVVDVRGNVDTRIARVSDDLHAVVLALAGLRRLGREAEASEVLDVEDMLPCPGQGALAVETRADDELGARIAAALDHPRTRAAVAAERSLLAVLEAGCSAPVGALARIQEGNPDRITLDGALGTGRGELVRVRRTGSTADAPGLGRGAGEELLVAAGISTRPSTSTHTDRTVASEEWVR